MFNKSKYDYEWIKSHCKRVTLNIPKENYERVQAHITSRGENLTAFINRAIISQMERDSVEGSKE